MKYENEMDVKQVYSFHQYNFFRALLSLNENNMKNRVYLSINDGKKFEVDSFILY